MFMHTGFQPGLLLVCGRKFWPPLHPFPLQIVQATLTPATPRASYLLNEVLTT